MKRLLATILALMLLAAPALAELDAPRYDPNLVFYADFDAGYEWTCTVEDESIVTVTGGEVTLGGDIESSGDPDPYDTFYEYQFVGKAPGGTFIKFAYGKPGEAPIITISYLATVGDDLYARIDGCETNPGVS